MSYNTLIPGSTTILAKLEVRNNPDLAVVDMQHIEGGSFSVADLATRNAIPQAFRQAGVSRCYVVAVDKTFILKGGIANANWQPELPDLLPVRQAMAIAPVQVQQGVDMGSVVAFPDGVFVDSAGVAVPVTGIIGLPDAVQFNPATRSLSGTPAEPGYVPVVVFAEVAGFRAFGLLPIHVRPKGMAGATAVDAVLAINSFVPIQPLQCKQGLAWSFQIPNDLFRSNKAAVQLYGVDGLPPGLSFSGGTISGTPIAQGLYTIIMLAQDTYGGLAQYVATLKVNAPESSVTPTPTTTGSAAINIITPAQSVCSVVLTSGGYAETGSEAFASTTQNQRFIGGTDVDNALALGSSGYSSVPGGIGYYSFAFNVNLFRSRYPNATQALFDVFVDPIATDPAYINRVNYSYHLSNGIEKKTLANGIDYGYKDIASSQGGFFGYDPGSGSGQQNTSYNLHDQFTITGNARKKIGVVTLNLSSGTARFDPIAAAAPPATNPAPVLAHQLANQTINQPGAQSVEFPDNTFSDPGDTLTYTGTGNTGAALPAGISFDPANRLFNLTGALSDGTYNLRVRATDSAGQTCDMFLTLIVNRTVVTVDTVAVYRTAENILQFFYKSAQTGDKNLEDQWTGFDTPGNPAPYLGSSYSAPPIATRPNGYQDYQYLDGYGTIYPSMSSALENGSTFRIRKVGETANILSFDFTAAGLALGEVRVIYPAAGSGTNEDYTLSGDDYQTSDDQPAT